MTRTILRTRTFPSSRSDAIYKTYAYSDGTFGCNCPGWTKTFKTPRECRHTRAMAAESAGGSTPAPEAPAPAVTRAAAPPAAPMLASAMTTPVTGAAFDRAYAGWLLEEKLDGHRCTARVLDDLTVDAWSRPRAGGNGANPRTLPTAVIDHLRILGPGLYDGELVAPSGKAWDVTRVGAPLVFVIFDAMRIGARDLTALPYTQRRIALLDRLAQLPSAQTAISTVESVPATWGAVEAIWARGGEGAIVKAPHSRYFHGYRSPDWVKVKEEGHDALQIIGFERGENGPCSKFVLRNHVRALTTTVKVLTNKLLAQVTATPDAFIGRWIVITYQHLTPSGTYRHGRFDHFAGPGEVPTTNPLPVEDSPMAKTTKTAKAKTTKPAAKVTAKPAAKAAKAAAKATPATKATKAKAAKADKPAKAAKATGGGRAAVDWVAAGRKAYETKMRNLADKAAKDAQAATN